jgi:hypothetical protein
MRAADDFESIRNHARSLRRSPKTEPAACTQHSFDPADDRCIHCGLHYFHLPAMQNRRSAEIGENPFSRAL